MSLTQSLLSEEESDEENEVHGIVESEMEEEEEIIVQRISGDYNMEIPEVLHCIFLHLDARELVRIIGVSKIFYRVGTSDYLWSFILTNRKDYIEREDFQISKFFFLYDINPLKDKNIFEKAQQRFSKAYFRKKRIERRRLREERQEKMKKVSLTILDFIVEYISVPFFGFFAFLFTCICHPLATLCWGVAGTCRTIPKVKEEYGYEEGDFQLVVGLLSADSCICSFCNACFPQSLLFCFQACCGCFCCNNCWNCFCCCGGAILPCCLSIFFVSCFVGSWCALICGPCFSILFAVVWMGRTCCLGNDDEGLEEMNPCWMITSPCLMCMAFCLCCVGIPLYSVGGVFLLCCFVILELVE